MKEGSKKGVTGMGIDRAHFERLCNMMCTRSEICSFFNVSVDTLLRWCKKEYDGKVFRDVQKGLQDLGKISLRRTQFKHADNNVTMAIFLGKQYLGQREIVEEKIHEKVEIINDIPDVK